MISGLEVQMYSHEITRWTFKTPLKIILICLTVTSAEYQVNQGEQDRVFEALSVTGGIGGCSRYLQAPLDTCILILVAVFLCFPMAEFLALIYDRSSTWAEYCTTYGGQSGAWETSKVYIH